MRYISELSHQPWLPDGVVPLIERGSLEHPRKLQELHIVVVYGRNVIPFIAKFVSKDQAAWCPSHAAIANDTNSAVGECKRRLS